MSDSDLSALADAVVGGDQAAFGSLYDRFAEETYSVFRHHNESQVVADEVMLQFWISVWCNAASIFHSGLSPRGAITAAVSQWPNEAHSSRLAS